MLLVSFLAMCCQCEIYSEMSFLLQDVFMSSICPLSIVLNISGVYVIFIFSGEATL